MTPTAQDLQTASTHAVLPLWRLFTPEHDAACEVAKIPTGFEGRFLLDGRFLYSHQFAQVDDVLRWAQGKQIELRQRGWSRVMPVQDPFALFQSPLVARHAAQHAASADAGRDLR